MCPKEQLGIVELVEIVDRISRSEFDSLDFLQINIENSLLMRGLAAEFQALKRIFYCRVKRSDEHRRRR